MYSKDEFYNSFLILRSVFSPQLDNSLIKANICITCLSFILLVVLVLMFRYRLMFQAISYLYLKMENECKHEISGLIEYQNYIAKNALIEGKENERLRIGKELHDGIGPGLACIKLFLTDFMKENDGDQLKKAIDGIDDIYDEIRSISHNLVPVKIADKNFIDLFKAFIDNSIDRGIIKVDFIAFPEDKINLLSNGIKLEMFRILQELLNNINRHSRAKNIEIQLIERDNLLILLIEDDGIGFDTNHERIGIGLKNVESRINFLNGNMKIESSPGKWTIVNIEIPLN